MIKAPQTSLDQFLSGSMSIIAENAGAERGALVLKQHSRLVVVAEFTARHGTLIPKAPSPIAESASVPQSVVVHVLRTQERVILSDAVKDGTFGADPYVIDKKPKAVICAPLVHNDEIIGAVYLENNLGTGAFTHERAEMLSALCAQAAIAIDNAVLSADLDQQLLERTRELKEAQARLVQLENEVTEAQMAGGFAHEMRNALAGAKLMLTKVYRQERGDEAWSKSMDNRERLAELFLKVREHLPPSALHEVAVILRSLGNDENDMHRVLQGIDRALIRGLGITRLVLDYAQIGKGRPKLEAVCIKTLIKSVIEEMDDDLKSHQISVQLDIPDSCTLLGDELHYFSIFKNLINNARDALLEVKEGRPRSLSICAAQEPSRIVISFSDSGVGIPAELHEKIFAPFFSTKAHAGTGLGLGMVRKLVLLYGGRIELESKPQYGATFHVVFPRRTSPTEHAG